MPKFPEPPSQQQLRELEPELYVLQPDVVLWRIFRRSGAHPVAWNEFRAWGPVKTARFDHHVPPTRTQGRRILYAATLVDAAVAEAFQPGRVIDVDLGEPWLVGFTVLEPPRLLDLTGLWPTAAGASTNINSGPRERAQRWARAIYAAYPEVAGLWYGSSMHANTPCVALFERAEHALPSTPIVALPLADPLLEDDLRRIAHRLRYRLLLRS